MKGDFSRFSRGHRRYSSVLMQQGRVSLDADWNEAASIVDWQRRQRTIDMLGYFAVIGEAFRVTYLPNFRDFAVEAGRAYLAGHLIDALLLPPIKVELRKKRRRLVLTAGAGALDLDTVYRFLPDVADAAIYLRVDAIRGERATASIAWDGDLAALPRASAGTVQRVVTYRTQDVIPSSEAVASPVSSPPSDTASLVYLDAWERHVTAVEDPDLREEALGGPDTSTRTQTEWAIRVVPVDRADAVCIGRALPPDGERAFGRLSAWVDASEDRRDPGLLESAGGYDGLEDRLYRVEVHNGTKAGGSLDDVTFKWARDNGSVVTAVEEIRGSTASLVDLGYGNGLSGAPLIELHDRVNERTPSPGMLLEPIAIDVSGSEVEFARDVSTDEGRPWRFDSLRARRWDGVLRRVVPATAVDLEDGISLSFTEGLYRPGDYWVFPARTASRSIGELSRVAPMGVEHAHAELAVVASGEPPGEFHAVDCRPALQSLTDLAATRQLQNEVDQLARRLASIETALGIDTGEEGSRSLIEP